MIYFKKSTVVFLFGLFAFARIAAQTPQPGSLVSTFQPPSNSAGNFSSVDDLAIQSDGKVVVNYLEAGGNEYQVARLTADGALDPTFDNRIRSLYNGRVDVVAIQAGKIIAGGRFTTIGGTPYGRIARFDADGNLDNTFNTAGSGFGGGLVGAIFVQSDNKLIVGGEFSTYNGAGHSRLIRLLPDGAVDGTFNTGSGPNATVYSIHQLTDGKFLITGAFTTYNSLPVSKIARLNADGTLDGTFVPPAIDASVHDVAVQADGKYVIGGHFQTIGGVSRNYIARLNADGSHDLTFDPGTGGADVIYTVHLEPSGKILTGGWFQEFNGVPQGSIVRLMPDGSIDPFFITGGGANSLVMAIESHSPDKIFVAGYFDQWNGVAHNGVAVLNDACIVEPGGVDNTSCSGSITISATGGMTGQYRWYTQSSGGTAITGETNASLSLTGLTSTTTYYVALNDGVCEGGRTPVTATINLLPPPSITSSSGCIGATQVVSASGASAGEYRWYTTSSGGTAIAGETNSTYTTPALSTTTIYYVSIDNGSCESSRVAVTATVDVVTPPSTTNSTGCMGATQIVSATGGSAGQYRWYTTSSGGTAISGETNASYTTPALSATTTYYVSINNGACESDRISVTAAVTVVAPPSVTNGSGCSGTSQTVSASGASPGQYRWYTTASGGSPITGETNASFNTPLLTATTTYYVSINNGSCESTREPVTATVIPLPFPPEAVSVSTCVNTSAVISATGAANGNYRWYTVSSGGTPISGQVNSSFTTPVLSANTTYYVSVVSGTCESNRIPVQVNVTTCAVNQPPQIVNTPLITQIGGIVTLDLLTLISDPDNNLDPSSLEIIAQPQSGAAASINSSGILTLDYAGLNFAGIDNITIQACDNLSSCTTQQFSIEIIGDIVIYNAISPNGDGNNDIFFLQYIDAFAETQTNNVSIYNRWGDVVFEVSNYDNINRVFRGLNNNGNELPSGTYFYKIKFPSREVSGYLTLRK